MPAPWNNWWHCIGTLKYGWLRGDRRGWRARHHREHVIGDYRHPPPPGTYEAQRRQSISLRTRFAPLREAPSLNDFEQRVIVCRLFAQALAHYDVGVR